MLGIHDRVCNTPALTSARTVTGSATETGDRQISACTVTVLLSSAAVGDEHTWPENEVLHTCVMRGTVELESPELFLGRLGPRNPAAAAKVEYSV